MKPVFAFLFVLAFSIAPWAKATKPDHPLLTADKLTWVDGSETLPTGAKLTVLHGDPKSEGLFAIRLKFPSGWKAPAHTHPADEQITVIKGSFWLGTGEKFEKDKLHEIPTGGFAIMNKGTNHFAMAKGETIIQIQAIGPWGIDYMNPADDPRTEKK